MPKLFIAMDYRTAIEHFTDKKITNVVVIRASSNDWYFTFDVIGGGGAQFKTNTYFLKTQRGKRRRWGKPATLFAFLLRNGIKTGTFNLKKVSLNEKNFE